MTSKQDKALENNNETGAQNKPVRVELKKAISCRIRESNRLVRIRTFSRVMPMVNRPPLMPVKTAQPSDTITSFRQVHWNSLKSGSMDAQSMITPV